MTASNKMAPMIGSKDRIGDPTQITVPTRALGVLPAAECATRTDLRDYVKKSELPAHLVPVPDNVLIPTPVVGEGASLITASKTMNVSYLHTPGPDDNFLLVFVSYMIPPIVPGGSTWTMKVTYGGKDCTFFQEYNSASVAADRTRGTIRGYWLTITPDPSQTPQEVVITCTTGTDLTGKDGDPTYAFRSNSVTMANRTASNHVGGDNNGAASINVGGAAGFNRRWIGFVHVPTTPSRTFVNTFNGPAQVLWEVDDNGGRRVLIYTTTDEHAILHGGQPANAYSSAHITVNATAPPKVL